MFFPFFDGPIGIVIMLASLAIAGAAQAGVMNAYRKYSQVRASGNMTGADLARRIVSGLGVEVFQHNGGQLSDHFDPRTKRIGLSPDVYNGTDVAALGIAAHEAGHALQHDQSYIPIKLRNAILPLARIGSMAAMPLVLLGFLFGGAANPMTIFGETFYMPVISQIGILLFSAVLLFQLITLPVEFNASRRAIETLDTSVNLTPEEFRGAKKVLRAAAMTYVAAVAVAALQLLRLLLMSRRRR